MATRTLSQIYGGQSVAASGAKRSLSSIYNKGGTVLTNPTGTKAGTSAVSSKNEYNVGGPLGGAGYLGEKAAVGFVSSIEGISDYVNSGFAKLIGNDAWAEEIIKNDWFGDWYSHPEEWYNPDSTMQFWGDVAGGIGTSLPAMGAAIGTTLATGGAAAPVAVSTFLTASLGSAGRSTKEAYEQTGSLGAKEFGYGALSGLTEGSMETVSNLIGMGTGAVIKSFTKAAAKETAEAFVKQGLVKTLGKSFIGEAFEESASEFLTPYWKKLTYDPKAKDASVDEILYAGLVGGISGAIMGGGGYAYDSASSFIRGNRLSQNGGDAEVLETSKYWSDFAEREGLDEEIFSEIKQRRADLLKSLETTGGKATTVAQQRELGALSKANFVAAANKLAANRAYQIVNNAELISEKLNAYGYKKADGTPISYTAEQITAGYDAKRPQSIYKALKNNDILRSLTVADVTGHLMMDTAKFTKATLAGQRLASQVDLNRFIEQASPEEVSAVSKALGIESWSGLTAEEFAQKITNYINSGAVESTINANETKKRLSAIPKESAKPIPKLIDISLAKDGAYRYSDGRADFSVERMGDAFTVLDNNTGELTRAMNKSEVNGLLRRYGERGVQNAELGVTENGPSRTSVPTDTNSVVEEIKRFQSEVKGIDDYARANIKEYKSLSDGNKSMIRKIFREGRTNNINEDDLLMLARVSARSGVDIQFKDDANFVRKTVDGKEIIADGYYEASKNRIVVNPEAKRTGEALLIHELDHAITKTYDKKGRKAVLQMYKTAFEDIDENTRKAILSRYGAKSVQDIDLINDETNSVYAEKVLTNRYTLEKLLEAEPSLKEKILNFFKGASKDYADVPKLSGAAKKYYKTYKKLFDEFSARNAENNAIENARLSSDFEKNAQNISITGVNSENMQVSDRRYAVETENKTRITAEMPDSERASVLRNRTLTAPIYKDQANSVIEDVKRNYEREKKAFGKKAIVEIAEKLGIIGELIDFDDIDVQIELSKSNLRESIVKEADPLQVAKLLPILSQTAKASVVVERHNNRYYYDTDTEYVDNLIGAYIDGESLVPVRFGLKHSKMGKTTLYVLVDQNKIPLEKLGEIKNDRGLQDATADNSAVNSLHRSVTYSISQILSFVNSKDLLRYIPDDFLDSNRIDAKRKAIAETQEYTDEKNDKKYSDFVKQGNLRAAEDMLAAKAKDVGYSDVNAEGKSKDITYDDDGKLIPISKRYDRSNPDRQYALPLDEDNISGAEVLGWMKKKPAGDGKIDLEATVARGLPYKRGKSDLTVGELRKVVANSTHEKVYSKKDALKVVNKFSGSSGLTIKAREEIADTIWQFLNEAPDIEYRADMANDIAEFIVAKILVDSKTENPDAIAAAETLSYLRTGIGKISFTDGEIDELRHAVDEKGVRSLIGRWGYKGAHKVAGAEQVSKRRTPMDVFVTEIAREMPGMEHLEEMHPVEAFLEIDKMYQDAYDGSKDKWISSYWDMPDSEVPAMISGVRDAILEAYSNEGEKSKFTKLMEEKISSYQKRAEYYKAERDEIKGRDKILGLLMNQATKMKDLKMGTYANATQHDSDVLRSSVERLSRIQFRGNLNVSGTRDIIRELGLWYNTKNSMLGYVDEKTPGYYVQGIADMLNALSEGEGGFSKADLTMLYDVMAYFTNFVETYRKVYRKGQWVDADVEAKRYVNIMQGNKELQGGVVRKLLGSSYMQTFGDPMTVARRMDSYESGFFTEMMEELREGALGAQVAESEIMEVYDDFLNKNRKYVEKTASEEVVYHGEKIPKMQLIGLYMTLKRKHSRAGLAENGFYFENLKGERIRVNGFAIDVKDITEAEIDKRAEEQIDIIARQLTDTDKEYIKILERAYNVDARKLKADRDMQRLGFTNAGLGYYYPIRRGNIAKNVDSSDYMAEMDRVTNSSFNKNTVRGARQELYIENADVVFRRHVRAVTQYAYLAPAVESYNMLYNTDVGGNPNHPISVSTESANVWDKGNAYFKKLISDIQGIPAVSGEGKEILSKIRGGYAKFQLGANLKVWFTQGSSLFSATSLLDADSIIKGATVSAEGIDKYCPLAKLRNSENTAAIAQAVVDTRGKKVASGIGKISDALMVPIGKVDRFVVTRLFGAAQVQVEKNGGAKVGTEQNKIEAGKLLEKVIFETQQNSIATERSAAMRSGSEFMKGITMFTADSMKVAGRVIDGLGEVLTLKERIKKTSDSDTKAELEKRLKSAEQKTKKALGAMVTSSIYMACIAQLFRWLYDKEKEEDETTFGIIAADVAGNLIGGLPLVKDAISRIFLGGYELENNSYAVVNDLINSAATLKTVSEKAFSGELEAEERNRTIRNMAYSVGQLTGLPFRNVYNTFYGLTKRFVPATAFRIDSAFYKKNYQTELNKAVEAGDNEMTSFILGLMLEERVDGKVPQSVFDEMLSLTKNGHKAVPKVMPNKVTIGGEEYTLNESEREAMKKIYSGAQGSLEKLFVSPGYKTLSAEEKVLAIDHVYDTYYAMASEAVLGTDGGNRAKVAGIVGADVLANLYIKTKGLTSDKDEDGKTVSGSKRAKVVKAIGELKVSTEERLLLICASGYSLKDGDIRGVSAEAAKNRLLKYIINLKGLSVEERGAIAEMCGFEVKNGKIVMGKTGASSTSLPKLKLR